MKNFLKRFPEFENTEAKLIEMALAESEEEMSSSYWGALFETASYYLAAHKLAISPMGESCRLQTQSEKTIYQLEYERLRKSSFIGAHVI